MMGNRRHPSPPTEDSRRISMDGPLPHGGPRATATGSSGIDHNGITHCLHLLAEDAARLGLRRTHLAICQVVEICEAECAEREPGVASGAPPVPPFGRERR
jgi:hypothetical protein